MADIVLSAAVRNNLLALQNTAKLLGKTQERLATGLKVNSALDDPNAFFTSAALDARASDLNRLLDTVDLAVQTIKAADQGLTAITKLVESAQALARQALLSPPAPTTATAATVAGTGAALLSDQAQIATGSGTFDTSGGAGSFTVNGFTVNYALNDTGATVAAAIGTATGSAVTATFNGSSQLVLTAANADTAITLGGTNLAAAGLDTTTATQAQRNLLTQGITSGQTLTIGIGANANPITFGNGGGQVSTLAELTTALGGITGGTASIDGSGNLTVTAANTTDSITLGGTALANFGTNLTTTPTAPVSAPPGTPNPQRANLATQYGAVLDQITQLARDASFNGTNLINSDNLIVIFNEDSSSTLTIAGVDFTATGLGLAPAAGTFQLNTEINSILGTLDGALRTLRAQAGTFGSNLSIVEVRKDFTKNLINTLETGAANLKIADSNEEGANLLALQTRQQLSSTALSLASQADQNVLRLFQ